MDDDVAQLGGQLVRQSTIRVAHEEDRRSGAGAGSVRRVGAQVDRDGHNDREHSWQGVHWQWWVDVHSIRRSGLFATCWTKLRSDHVSPYGVYVWVVKAGELRLHR
jgi:hypothetical protein